MTLRLCKKHKIDGGRRLICRRVHGHEGECAWSLLQAKPIKHPLLIVAQMSALIRKLPEGDYTDLVGRVYINRDLVMIEFNQTNPEELIKLRKKGDH